MYSAIATVIASGLLLAKTPPVFHPYVETLIGLVIAFHPSPIAITPHDVLERLATFSTTAEAIVPAADKPYVEDAVAVARSLEPLIEHKKQPAFPDALVTSAPGNTTPGTTTS